MIGMMLKIQIFVTLKNLNSTNPIVVSHEVENPDESNKSVLF